MGGNLRPGTQGRAQGSSACHHGGQSRDHAGEPTAAMEESEQRGGTAGQGRNPSRDRGTRVGSMSLGWGERATQRKTGKSLGRTESDAQGAEAADRARPGKLVGTTGHGGIGKSELGTEEEIRERQPGNCAGQQGAARAKGERQGAQRLARREPEPEQKSERHGSSRPLAGQYGSRDTGMEELDEALGVCREQTGELQGAAAMAGDAERHGSFSEERERWALGEKIRKTENVRWIYTTDKRRWLEEYQGRTAIG
jgi:hypothetical protein|uniref:Uncharacterized protein n=1 Tax=Zea mays TaxID=4577 RepID=A0A804NS02_MAIZE